MYSLQLNCTYRNYTQAAATCSAAQQQSTFTVKNVQYATELYLQELHRSCCYMFSCTTAQHIYCTNTVQTVQSATELYLQELHRSCCYVFSCITAHKLRSWCILKWSADASLKLHTHTYPEIRSFILTLLAASAVSQFDSDKKQVDGTKVTEKLCKLKDNSRIFILKCRFV